MPYHGRDTEITIYRLTEGDAHERLVEFAHAFPGPLRKDYSSDTLRLAGELHGLSVEFAVQRADVCKRVVTGTREVESLKPTAFETVTETVEDVEWVCEPLLAGDPS